MRHAELRISPETEPWISLTALRQSIKISVCWTPVRLLNALLDFKQLWCCIVHSRLLNPQIKNKYSSVCIQCKYRHFWAVHLVTVGVCQSAPYIRISCTQIWALVRTLVYLTLGLWWLYFSARHFWHWARLPYCICSLLLGLGVLYKTFTWLYCRLFFSDSRVKRLKQRKKWRPLTKRLG